LNHSIETEANLGSS